jgi:hypothetical protein
MSFSNLFKLFRTRRGTYDSFREKISTKKILLAPRRVSRRAYALSQFGFAFASTGRIKIVATKAQTLARWLHKRSKESTEYW